MRATGIIFILLLLFGASYFYFSKPEEQQSSRQGSPNFKVDVIEVKRFTIQDEIEALGTAFANEAVDITANTTDKITHIKFEDGQVVKQNDILVILDQEEELAQKNAILAQKAENERELKRLSSLLERNATAKNEYDQRKTLLLISESRLEEIEARIRDKTIRAPFDGVLGLRKISVGSLVVPGTVITTIDDISQIKLDFSVPSTYLDVVKPGLGIEAKSEALDEIFKGKVTTLDSRVDARTRSVEARAILPNPKGDLKPGILLSVRLLRNERDAMVIPEEAVIQIQAKHFVYVVEDQTVIRKEITIGKRAPGWVEVLEGLQLGDKVMTRGQIRVRPGDTIEYNTQAFSIAMVGS